MITFSEARAAKSTDETRPPNRRIPLRKLHANPWQPRIDFAPSDLRRLADSITANGLIQPITVRPRGDGEFEIVDGERRRRAAKLAKLTSIECHVREVDDREMAILAIEANDCRAELGPFERAAAYARIVEAGTPAAALSRRLGRSSAFVSNTILILKLPDEWQELIRRGEVYTTVGNDLRRIFDDSSAMAEVLARVKRLCAEPGYSIPGATAPRKLARKRAAPLAGADVQQDGFSRRATNREVIQIVAETIAKRSADHAVDDDDEPGDEAAAIAINDDSAGERRSKKAPAPDAAHAAGDDDRSADSSDRSAIAAVKARWYRELLMQEIERRDVAELLDVLGVDLHEIWGSGQLCRPFTYDYFSAHSKPELLALADELGVAVSADNPKEKIVSQLIASHATKRRLPAELEIGGRP